MFNPNLLGSDESAVVGVIAPVSQAAGTVTSGWIAAKDFFKFMAVLSVGVLGASATVDAKLQQAQDGSGTGAKDITGKAITQLTKAASDDSKQVVLHLHQSQLDVQNNFTHFRFSVTVGTAASLITGLVVGMSPRQAPASLTDAASVKEIVTA